MRAGVRAGRIVTTERADRERRTGTATRADAHYVYRRQGLPCRRCGTAVRTQVMAAAQPVLVPDLPGPLTAARSRPAHRPASLPPR